MRHVIDLGKDVDPKAVVDAVIKEDVKLVGLSAEWMRFFASSRVAPQEFLILSQHYAWDRIFCFSGRLFHVCLHKTMAQPRCIRNFEPAFERIKTNLKGSINL